MSNAAVSENNLIPDRMWDLRSRYNSFVACEDAAFPCLSSTRHQRVLGSMPHLRAIDPRFFPNVVRRREGNCRAFRDRLPLAWSLPDNQTRPCKQDARVRRLHNGQMERTTYAP